MAASAASAPAPELDDPLSKAVAMAVAIPGLPAHKQTADADSDAFEALRAALFAVKKDEAALRRYREDDMCHVLELCIRRGKQKKTAIGRAKECLGMLLASDDWLRGANTNAELLASLKEFVADTPLLVERLSMELPPADVRARPPAARVAAAEQEVAEAKAEVESKLLSGRKIMQSFGFKFPQDHLSEKLDQATDGFMKVCEAVTRLDRTIDKAGKGCSAMALLDTFQEKDCENFLLFFLTMYRSGVRNSFRLRIEFVVDKLKELCPTFRTVAERSEWQELASPAGGRGASTAAGTRVNKAAEATAGSKDAPTVTWMVSQEPVVVWIDFKKEAYESSALAKASDVRLEGFHDDEKTASFKPALECLRFIRERCSDSASRVDVVIMNKKHMDLVPDIVDCCKAVSRPMPKIIVVSRTPSDVSLAAYGISEAGAVVTKWEEATKLAIEEVARRRSAAER